MEVFAIQNSEKSCLKALAFRHKATPCFKGNLKLIRIACMHVLVISIKYSEKKKKHFTTSSSKHISKSVSFGLTLVFFIWERQTMVQSWEPVMWASANSSHTAALQHPKHQLHQPSMADTGQSSLSSSNKQLFHCWNSSVEEETVNNLKIHPGSKQLRAQGKRLEILGWPPRNCV